MTVLLQVMLAQQRTITTLIEAVNSSQVAAQKAAGELLLGRSPPGCGLSADAYSQQEAAMAAHRLERCDDGGHNCKCHVCRCAMQRPGRYWSDSHTFVSGFPGQPDIPHNCQSLSFGSLPLASNGHL